LDWLNEKLLGFADEELEEEILVPMQEKSLDRERSRWTTNYPLKGMWQTYLIKEVVSKVQSKLLGNISEILT